MRLNDLLKLATVRRWHIVDVLKEQSVAEHSASVAYIALEVIRRTESVDDIHMMSAMWWALFHDAHEALLGDPPGNLKACPGISEIYNAMAGYYTPTIKNIEVSDEARIAVKIADLIESIRFIGKYGVATEGHLIEADLRDRLKEYAEKTVIYKETYESILFEAVYGEATIVNVNDGSKEREGSLETRQ